MDRQFAPLQIGIRLPEKYRRPSYAKTPYKDYLKMYEAYAARYGHSQSAERICERGGLSISEVFELGIREIDVYFAYTKDYPKDNEWVHLHLSLNKNGDAYKWFVVTE